MSSIIAILSEFFASAFGKALTDIFASWRAEKNARDVGSMQSQITLDDTVKEIADERASVAADHAANPNDLARRLRERANRNRDIAG